MTMYHLLEHPNPNGDHFYTSRRRPILAWVVHITAGLEDFTPPDDSAERTADYASSTSRRVSWHDTVDSDSVVPMLPDGYTAFHVRGYNSSTGGTEICKRNTDWNGVPGVWVGAVLDRAAEVLAPRVARHGLPVRHATKDELDAAVAAFDRDGTVEPVGFIGHAALDPTRRTDPGANFPWQDLFDRIEARRQEDEVTEEQMDQIAEKVVDRLMATKIGGYDPFSKLGRESKPAHFRMVLHRLHVRASRERAEHEQVLDEIDEIDG